MLEFRSNGRRVTLDQFMKNIEEKALDMALDAIEKRVHGAAASIVDPETGRHADVFVRRRGDDLGVTIHTRGSQAFARELERRLGVEQGTVMSTAPKAKPLVYLAHASEDHDTLAKPLAQRLIASGIDVWLDEWEIRPGDSLKRKMESGLEQCTHFLVLLTPASIGKAWVETEIDAGFLRALGGEIRFIGLRIGTALTDLSVFLRTLLCPTVDLADETQVQKIIADLHGATLKPPLGDKPRYVQHVPSERGGWSQAAYTVGEHFTRTSKLGRKFDPQLRVTEIAAATGLPEQDVRLALLDLVDAGLIEKSKALSDPSYYPVESFFVEFDSRFLDFDSQKDAVAVANWIVSNGSQRLKTEQIAQAFPQFTTRRLNSALNYLEKVKAIDARHYLGGGDWAFSALTADDRILRFVRQHA